MNLSVIVCTRNRADELVKCLQELKEQTKGIEGVEIIIVDNGSTDHTKEVAARFTTDPNSRCRYVYEPVPGPCAARNRGRAEAKGAVLACIDDDAVPHPGWIAVIREHFLAGRSDCLAGKTVLRLQDELPEWFPTNLNWVLGESQFGERERELTPGECPNAGNCAFRIDVFDAIGGFNPNLRIYYEEVDFFGKARRMGFSFYYRSDLAIDHCVSAKRLTKSALREKAYQMGFGCALMVISLNAGARFRLKTVALYFYRIARVSVAWCARPRFDREFTLWQYTGVIRGLFSRLN